MSDPSIAIQDAIEAALRNDEPVKAQFGGLTRLYTLSAPVEAQFPYLLIGEDLVQGADMDCGSASEVAVTVHIYAREAEPAESRKKSKALAGAVRSALALQLEPAGHLVVDWAFEATRHLTDPDGLTAHSVVTLNYYTEPTA